LKICRTTNEIVSLEIYEVQIKIEKKKRIFLEMFLRIFTHIKKVKLKPFFEKNRLLHFFASIKDMKKNVSNKSFKVSKTFYRDVSKSVMCHLIVSTSLS